MYSCGDNTPVELLHNDYFVYLYIIIVLPFHVPLLIISSWMYSHVFDSFQHFNSYTILFYSVSSAL